MMLTIITINKNDKMGLQRTQQSLEAQINQDFKWIVVDGKSSDGSISILSTRANITISEKDAGIYDAMNKGLNMAKGHWVMFLNSGDKLTRIDVTKTIIDELGSAEVLYTDIVMSNDGTITRKWRAGRYSYFKALLGWHPPHPGFVFLNKKYAQGYFSFNLDLSIAADYDLMLRILKDKALTHKYLPFTTVDMELGGVSNGSFKNIIKANLQCLTCWKNDLFIPVWLPLTKPLSKLAQYIAR